MKCDNVAGKKAGYGQLLRDAEGRISAQYNVSDVLLRKRVGKEEEEEQQVEEQEQEEGDEEEEEEDDD